jgi:HD-like signal output (HDOD) protein
MIALEGEGHEFLKDLDDKYALPSVSPIVTALIELAADEESSLGQISELIAKDPALTTRVIRLANSSFFRSCNPAATVLQAVARIGVRHTRLLALSVSLKNAFSLKPGDSKIDYARFWRLSLYQGLLARWLAQNLGTADPDEAFTAGLTLEIGFLVLVRTFARDSDLSLECSVASLLVAEKERYGLNHRQIGEVLLRNWRFPEDIVACQRGFALTTGLQGLSNLARICAIAEELSGFICHPQARPDQLFGPGLPRLGLSQDMAIEAVSTALEQVREVAASLDVEVNSVEDTIGLMEKANHALARLAGESFGSSSPGVFPAFEMLADLNQAPDTVKITLEAVAHEIRNPLTAMGGLVRRLAKIIDPESHEATYIRSIVTETEKLEKALSGMKRMLA